MRIYHRWAIQRPGNNLNEDTLMGNYETQMTTLYLTRAEARKDKRMLEYNAMLRTRKDLRQPPFSWKAKRPVRVDVIIDAWI